MNPANRTIKVAFTTTVSHQDFARSSRNGEHGMGRRHPRWQPLLVLGLAGLILNVLSIARLTAQQTDAPPQ